MTLITVKNIKDFEFSFKGLDEVYEKEKMEYEQKVNAKLEEFAKVAKVASEYGFKKTTTKEKQEEFEFPLTKKYLRERIYSCNATGLIYVIEDGKLESKGADVWTKYANKIHQKGAQFTAYLKDCPSLYKCCVEREDYIVDLENHRLNLKPHLPFSYDLDAPMDKEKGEYIIEKLKEILCSNSGDDWKTFRYFIGCLAKSQLSQVILVLQSLGGVGKSFCVNKIIARLIGNGFQTTNEKLLSGEDVYNESFLGKRCIFLDETSGVSPYVYSEIMKNLKRWSTSPTMEIRRMRVSIQEVVNLSNFLVCTNFPLDLDGENRRIHMPTVNNKYQLDTEFFSNFEKMITTEALQYVFNYFYETDTSKIVEAPVSDFKADYKESRIQNTLVFLISEFIIRNPKHDYTASLRDMYELYENWCVANKKKCSQFVYFANTVRQYVEKAMRPDGKEKKVHGSIHHNFSCDHLYKQLIEKSKVLTEDQYNRWVYEYEQEQKNADVFDNNDDKEDSMKKIIEEKDKKISELEQELENLKKLLEEKKEKKKEKKDKKEKVGDEFDVQLEKPIKYKPNPNKDCDLNNLLD